MVISIVANYISPRLEYIANFVFQDILGMGLTYSTQGDFGKNCFELRLPNGKNLLYKSEILFEEGDTTSEDFDWNRLTSKEELCSNWLGACFYLLSRMEEYDTKTKPDQHGRFEYKKSVAYLHGFLEKPLIEVLAQKFINLYFTGYVFPNSQTKIIPTLDIDMTHAVKGKPIWRVLPAVIQELIQQKSIEKFLIWIGRKDDPYDNFDYQLDFFEKNNLSAIYFFQVGLYGTFDKNLNIQNRRFKEVLEKCKFQTIAIHPSYASFQNYSKVEKEILKLKENTGLEIICSRQHFLRFKLPESYRIIQEAGIQKEYSMGYSESLGFRASVSRPFIWFDLQQNKATNLTIQPFCVMDVTLQYFMKLDIEQAKDKITQIYNQVNNVGGVFSFCFHNESLCDQKQWKGWREVFEYACLSLNHD